LSGYIIGKEDKIMTFQEALKELREIAGKKYHALTYELSEHFDGELEVECEVYIDGHKFFKGKTWRAALDKAREELELLNKVDLTEAPKGEKWYGEVSGIEVDPKTKERKCFRPEELEEKKEFIEVDPASVGQKGGRCFIPLDK
jgi:hypothetical protein